MNDDILIMAKIYDYMHPHLQGKLNELSNDVDRLSAENESLKAKLLDVLDENEITQLWNRPFVNKKQVMKMLNISESTYDRHTYRQPQLLKPTPLKQGRWCTVAELIPYIK